ncbi:MAG TPA: GNAT family N-acetyltransferase [Gemmatimonadaceae bacterium]
MRVSTIGSTGRAEHAPTEHEIIPVGDATRVAPIVDEWRDLAARIDGSSYFQTPDWVLASWDDAGRPPAELALWRDASGALEAVVCLARTRERLVRQLPLVVRTTTNLGSGRPHSADHCGWPVLPNRVSDVQRWLARHRWRNALVLRHLDPQTGVPLVPPGARCVLTTKCPRLVSAGSADAPIGSTKLRATIRRSKRKLDALGVSFSWIPPEAMRPDDVDLLFTLSESRRSIKGPSSFIRERAADFHRALIRRGGPGRGPAMVLATQHGEPIGILYGFVWRDTFSYYQSGWNASWATLSIGTVLVSEAIRITMERGLRCFDFLRGAEWYKYRFGGVDRLDETWLLPRGSSGWLVRGKYRLLRMQRVLRGVRGRPSGDQGDAS